MTIFIVNEDRSAIDATLGDMKGNLRKDQSGAAGHWDWSRGGGPVSRVG